MTDATEQGLPPGWAESTLGAIIEPRSGKADPQATPDAPFVGMEQIEAETMRLFGTVPAGTMKSGANKFEPGDVLYGRLRPYLNKVYQPDFAGLCSGELIPFPPTPAILGKFLKYRLNAMDFVRFANQLNTGDRPRVDFDQMKPFKVWLPPPSEQERISDAIEELLSDLDAGVEALKRVQVKLGHYRAAVLKAAVEGALTADWREQHPDTEPASELLKRILTERRRRWEESQLAKFNAANKQPPKGWQSKYKEPAAPDTTNLPALPPAWCWCSLDSCIASGPQNGLYLPTTQYGRGRHILRIDDFQSGWVRPANELKQVDADKETISLYALDPGDLVVNRVNSMTHLGKCLLVRATHSGVLFESNMMRAKLSPDLDGRWIELYLRSDVGRSRLNKEAKWAVNQASINQQDVRRTPLPLPPLAEQQLAVEIAELQLSVIDHLESDLDAKTISAQALRQSILRHAFTGQLVPQDPKDEPASELLKRIAAERDAKSKAETKKPRSRAKPAMKA